VSIEAWEFPVLVGGGFAAGFFNTLASSGSAVTLPLLIALGVPAPVANGTNRLAVLLGAASAVAAFHRARVMDWRNGLILTVPAVIGTAIGAAIASVTPASKLSWAIVGAVFLALALLLTRPMRWLVDDPARRPRVGPAQLLVIGVVGVWAGFIVLDSATYLLFALVLAVGYDLVGANAIKSLILLASSVVAMVVFIAAGDIDWTAGIPLAAGSVAGALVAARIAVSPRARVFIYRALLLVVGGEAIQLVVRLVHG
jgi:uncharacterized membrane protein YfcA